MQLAGLLITTFLFSLLTFSTAAQAEDKYKIKVQGVSGALKDNVEAFINKLDQEGYEPGVRLQSALEEQARTALQALGYYHSSISFTQPDEKRPNRLTMHVKPGEPVIIEQVDIQLNGDARNDEDFDKLINRKAPNPGVTLHQGQYDDLKSSLRSLALRKGYFDADFTESRLDVVPKLNKAFVHLHFDSGARYKFGEVTFKGAQIDERRMQSLVPFEAGDPYTASELGKLNQSVANTGWFASVAVQADSENINDTVIPLTVTVEPEARNIIETGIGFSTDMGPRFKLDWDKPWLNSSGHSLNTELQISEKEQNIQAGYKMPRADVATDFYQVQFGILNKKTETAKSRESNLALERHWLLGGDWYRTASIRWIYSDVKEADQLDHTSLIMPGVSFSRHRQSGEPMPRWADRLLLNIEVSDEAWGSDDSFVRLRAKAGWIGTLGTKHRFVTRLDGGAIFKGELQQIPLSLRFFAGGDNSIRGYRYESLPRQPDEETLAGGRYIATASLEYQYQIKEKWWLATFTDYGSAWDDEPDWQQGVGFGVRWASPVGSVRIDLAWGLDGPDSPNFRLHIGLGPEL